MHALIRWGRVALLVPLALSSIGPAHAADWMINEDYFQTDARAATAFEFLLAGDVASRITGGGLSSTTNAFSGPTRSSSLQPGFNNTIVRFAGSDTVATSPTEKRHFGLFGTGTKPTVLTKAWAYPSAPARVPVPKSNFSFVYDALTESLRITLENTSPDTVTFQNVGYLINSSETQIEQLTATGLPMSAFLPLTDFDHEYLPGAFFTTVLTQVAVHSYAISFASVFFSGASSTQDYQALGGEWAQVRVAAAASVPEPGPLALILAAGLAWAVVRARRVPARRLCSLLVIGSVGSITSLPCIADVWVVPLAAPPTAGDTRPFIDLKAKDTTGADITIKTLIDGGASSSELKVTAGIGTQLGVSGGTAGTERSINGTSPSTTGASIPAAAGVGFGGAAIKPPGQAAASPPLPTKATVGVLPPGRQATLGSGYLEANFDANGRIDGYYWFVAKGQGATGGVATANAIASFLAFSSPLTTNPDGRPKGTKSEEVTPLHQTLPAGEEATDGGYLLGVDVRSASTALSAIPFLLKPGLNHTILSLDWANSLGIDTGVLPTTQFEMNFGSLLVAVAELELDLFGDPGFPSFNVSVGIALNAPSSSLVQNMLGSDVLGQLAYWDIDQTNASAPRFSAAAGLSFVPEPGSAMLSALALLLLALVARPAPARAAAQGLGAIEPPLAAR